MFLVFSPFIHFGKSSSRADKASNLEFHNRFDILDHYKLFLYFSKHLNTVKLENVRDKLVSIDH